ncbi:DNA helicase-2/ATP-dependent DNA helicase PcrA [Haloactinopolyspora alba]|uniref:DNA 3'-5' helicase n=1 Tax=Haloactinopolyspora alba TaxID=648780 RepID=A0A2P8E6U8_9ACTN|nr:ATP-dependent helicase [Haloactinopolyspora alba]PSL05186.1 DNA helicase-2/ATP-dependent DNA helicase PcrA [Haloactinopolyspora alba]
MKNPTPAQVKVRDHESLSLLLVAPAGCGKTEALAIRIASLIENGQIASPQRILATTFTNKAKDNIQNRLRDYVTYSARRDHVTVMNYHGLAARLVRAHGAIIGVDPTIQLPESDWVTDRCLELGLGYAGRDTVNVILNELKRQPLDDAAIAAALAENGHPWAIQIEEERVAANRSTYDDLLRYAELILANDAVASLYRCHFGAIIVDEYQDLTPQQLRVLQRLGAGNITFAGDLAQGIYGFTGARPHEIDATIRPLCDEVIMFNESHRSSPAVLSMVNAMSTLTGGENLVCADPESWPGSGLAGRLTFPHAVKEAEWVSKAAQTILAGVPNHRVAVTSRIKSRLRFIDQHLEDTGIEMHRWEDGVLDTETAAIVRSTLTRLNLADLDAAHDKLTFLRDVAGIAQVEEPDTRKSLADALNWILERLGDGLSPAEVAGRIRVGDQTTLLNAPGIHLLSGHVGKGQQFDWVFILGAEDDNIPFFRATTSAEVEEEARILGVMLSRARHGVVVTHSEVVPTVSGSNRNRDRSRFWPYLDAARPRDREGIVEWVKVAPWNSLRDK